MTDESGGMSLYGCSRGRGGRRKLKRQCDFRDVTDSNLAALLDQRERIPTGLRDGVIQSVYTVALGLGAGKRVRTVTWQKGPSLAPGHLRITP